MYLPEWEIEEAIILDPKLIETQDKLEGLKFVERQKHLRNLGRYIDILFKMEQKYVIVEVKAVRVDQESIVTNQILEYKRGLAEELQISMEDIICNLATPEGFSEDVLSLCEKYDVIPIVLDKKRLIEVVPRIKDRLLSSFFADVKKYEISRILNHRGFRIDFNSISIDDLSDIYSRLEDQIISAKTWIKENIHDETAKRQIANIFRKISKKAPIEAHQVETDSNGKLLDFIDMWFWLFYSVMDRRANAATFIKARKALEKKHLFSPYQITRLLKEKGEQRTIGKITQILENSRFPLIVDKSWGKSSFPKSILDAAKLMGKYNYDFKKMYDEHINLNKGDLKATFNSLWEEIKNSIYGAGPRITSQFIRGMTLKGPWNLPLNDDKILEKGRFNILFAVPSRLSLIEDDENYERDLGQFADKYVEGNRGIISHVLWYIRKRYCSKKIQCDKCELSGYCRYFLIRRPVKYTISKQKNSTQIKQKERLEEEPKQLKLKEFL